MEKGLKALEYLKENKRKHWLEDDKSDKCLKIIEKELKESKARAERYDELLYTLNDINNERVDLLEVKKAVDLIKEKKVNMYYIDLFSNFKEYNAYIDDNFAYGDEYYLTEEEFDLLKEVLSD